jgi:hypothetical protein
MLHGLSISGLGPEMVLEIFNFQGPSGSPRKWFSFFQSTRVESMIFPDCCPMSPTRLCDLVAAWKPGRTGLNRPENSSETANLFQKPHAGHPQGVSCHTGKFPITQGRKIIHHASSRHGISAPPTRGRPAGRAWAPCARSQGGMKLVFC